MCNGPKYFGFDFNGDGNVSFEESYLTYRISKDIINRKNDDNFSGGYDSSDDFGGDDDDDFGDGYESSDDFGGDDY